MKVSLDWLKSWVDSDWDAATTAEKITMAGLEVDGMMPVAGQFNQVIVARVTQTRPHPDADKLTLCLVDTGSETVNIVCGANNVRPDLNVALAQIGAVLPNGMKIKPAKLRGQPSQGMLCSAVELGMADQSDGIMELPEDAPVGADIRSYLELDDTILDIDLTPNRADCFSVRGIAREVAALSGHSLKPLPDPSIPIQFKQTKEIALNAGGGCARFCGRVIASVRQDAKTPLWMQERLRRGGIRLIHPVVDITNYVMIELGQPMHAYDLNKIQGGLQVRNATDGETLTLLDDKTISLSPQDLVIADQANALSLAGVMGGAASSVTEQTQSIFLESAFFNPKHISGIARKYGLCTDSSQRFERGVDPELTAVAIEYATDLILSICGGEAGSLITRENETDLPQPENVSFKPAKVAQLTGVQLDNNQIKAHLQALEMTVDDQSSTWQVTPPACRFDISQDVDLVEEVIRLYGYQHIEGHQFAGCAHQGSYRDKDYLHDKLIDGLVMRGYHETVTYSFVDPNVQNAFYPECDTLNLLNPISSEMSQMRLGLWPGLIASMLHNLHRQHTRFHLFESGVIFNLSEGNLSEQAKIAGLSLGQRGSINWCDDSDAVDFYDVKGDIEAICAFLGSDALTFKPSSHTALHPGQCADIYHNKAQIGCVGQLHPRLASALDIKQTVYLFEIDLAAITDTVAPKQYVRFSKYPLIRRDLALLVDESVDFNQIRHLVQEAVADDLLKSVDVFDVYQGENIPTGKKSLAISVALQASDKTLTDDEINNKISAILKLLKQALSIELRES